MPLRSFTHSSVVPAPRTDVWARVTTPAGINDEMMPLIRMVMPRAHRDATVATVPIGVPLGRAWLWLFGVVPFDFDALRIDELEPGSHFQERSWMLSMKRWEHRREVVDADGGTVVTDTVAFWPRIPLLHHLLARLLPLYFAHRHRRLVRHFGG